MKKLVALTIALLTAGSLTASATVLIGSVPVSAQIQIPAGLTTGSGPVTSGNYTFTSTNAVINGGTIYGSTASYGFGDNGYWDTGYGPFIGLNDSNQYDGVTDTITVAFATPVYTVGDLFNYVPKSGDLTTIAVYDSTNTLIESYNLTFLTGGGKNTGVWLGFNEATPISSLTLTGNYIAMTAAPEDSTLVYSLLGVALLGAGAFFASRKMAAITPAA